MDFLTTLRTKPAHVKANIALGSAFLVSGLIALIWMTTLPAKFNEVPRAASRATAAEANGQSFGSFMGDLGKQIGGVRDALIPKTEEESASTTESAFVFSTSTQNSASSTTPAATTSTEVGTLSSSTASTTTPGRVILIGTSSKKEDR